MKYEGMIFRPPSEADSLILQVTVGCSYNRCTFCGAYQGKRFRIKSFEEIKDDVDEVSPYKIRRVFLADGDALSIPQKGLLQILSYLKARLKGLERVGVYANAKDILRKDVEELKALRELGLGILYLGLESGDPDVLKRIKKNATVDQLIRAGKRVKESGILLSVTVILGIGGVVNDSHAVHHIKGSFLEGQILGVRQSEVRTHFVGRKALCGDSQVFRGKIDSGDNGAGRGELKKVRPHSVAHLEHLVAGELGELHSGFHPWGVLLVPVPVHALVEGLGSNFQAPCT